MRTKPPGSAWKEGTIVIIRLNSINRKIRPLWKGETIRGKVLSKVKNLSRYWRVKLENGEELIFKENEMGYDLNQTRLKIRPGANKPLPMELPENKDESGLRSSDDRDSNIAD